MLTKYYSEKLCSKTFGGGSMKDAFLKASKWVATNIIADQRFHEITVEYLKDESLPQITAVLFVGIKEKEIQDEHCAICKEFSKSFFINEETNCNSCKVKGYQKRQVQHLEVKAAYYKELLKQKGAI